MSSLHRQGRGLKFLFRGLQHHESDDTERNSHDERSQPRIHDLSQSKNGCSDDQVGDVRRSYIVADVSLGVAIVALGAAAVTWIVAPGSSPATKTASGAALRLVP